MTTKITLYIGSPKKTKKINTKYIKKAEEILKKYWGGFTLIKHKGYYEGEIEESISVVIVVLQLSLKNLEDCINELKIKLAQRSIGYEIKSDVDFTLK